MSRLPPKFGDNQHIDIDKETWERLKAVVDTIHHKAPIRYAFAYGSGVFAQMGYDDKVGIPSLDTLIICRSIFFGMFHACRAIGRSDRPKNVVREDSHMGSCCTFQSAHNKSPFQSP